jgi:hypothetical protein
MFCAFNRNAASANSPLRFGFRRGFRTASSRNPVNSANTLDTATKDPHSPTVCHSETALAIAESTSSRPIKPFRTLIKDKTSHPLTQHKQLSAQKTFSYSYL